MEIKKQADLIRPAWEERITELLGKMTLDEKIGQLHQVGPSPVGGFAVSLEEHRQMLADGRITQEEFDAFCSGTARRRFSTRYARRNPLRSPAFTAFRNSHRRYGARISTAFPKRFPRDGRNSTSSFPCSRAA